MPLLPLSFLRAIQSDPANAGDIITITGHSLGGAIAQILGAASGDPTVTFDAPGAQQFLAPLQRLNILPNTLPSPSSQDENYRTQGDVVSYRGTQIGPMNTIPSNVTPSWGQALHNHSLGLLISQLLATASPMPGFTDSPLTLSVTDLAVFSSTIGHAVQGIGEQYVGPVAGLVQQYINVIADPLSIAVSSANWFVHSGSGDDAIAVSGGTNVLDGGTGSNFLTGGTGTDTFFVDDRAPPADIWSTVNNFHAGDAATVWGVTPNGFGIQWADGQGAAGFTGLTLHATASGKPTASITLSGYSASDLSNGRLSTSFGFDSASNSPYLYIFGRN